MQVYVELQRRNGRFLHRVPAAQAERHGIPKGIKAWYVADEVTALEKIKQALREKTTSSESPPFSAKSSSQPMSMPNAPSPKSSQSSQSSQPHDSSLNIQSPSHLLNQPLMHSLQNAVHQTVNAQNVESEQHSITSGLTHPATSSLLPGLVTMLERPPTVHLAVAAAVADPQQDLQHQAHLLWYQQHLQQQQASTLQRNMLDLLILQQLQSQQSQHLHSFGSSTSTFPPPSYSGLANSFRGDLIMLGDAMSFASTALPLPPNDGLDSPATAQRTAWYQVHHNHEASILDHVA